MHQPTCNEDFPHRFPVFQEGQTLTSHDLNLLRDFLDQRDHVVARLIGFGINCGLQGSVEADGLHISAGLAIDQHGGALFLEEDVVLPFPAGPDEAFDFMNAGPGGFTPVLVARDLDEEDPGECEEEGCEGHALVRCRTASIMWAAGRLDAEPFDFSTEALLGVQPLRVRVRSTVAGPFIANRDAILARIGDHLSPDARAQLAGLRIEANDLPGVAALKASFLNQLLFAVTDYLRCERLMSLSCLRETNTPGVALGWLREAGGEFVWDCDYRHSWEPPTGLSLTLIGGSCTDPCGLYLGRVEAMILTFGVPRFPDRDDDPDPGGTDPGDWVVCHIPHTEVLGDWLVSGLPHVRDCPWIVVPPDEPAPHWPELFEEIPYCDPRYCDPVPPWDIYEIDPPDWAEAGRLGLDLALGKEALGVQGALETVITGEGLEPDVRIVNPNDVDRLPGYRPALTASVSDTIVLSMDDRGKVTAVGHMPATIALRNAGTSIPRATEDAANAVLTADNALAEAGRIAGDIDAAVGRIDGLEAFQDDIGVWRADTTLLLDGIDQMIAIETQRAVLGLEADINARVDTAVSDSIAGIEQDLGDLGQRVWRTEGRTVELAAQAEVFERDTSRNSDRIDQVLGGIAVGAETRSLSANVAFNDAMVGFLRTMRRSVEAAAPANRLANVRGELARGDEALARLEGQARAGAVVLTSERESILGVVASLVGAAEAAGTPPADLRRLREDAGRLEELLQ